MGASISWLKSTLATGYTMSRNLTGNRVWCNSEETRLEVPYVRNRRAIHRSSTETHKSKGTNRAHNHSIEFLIRPLARSQILQLHWLIFERRAGYLHMSSIQTVCVRSDIRWAGPFVWGDWSQACLIYSHDSCEQRSAVHMSIRKAWILL